MNILTFTFAPVLKLSAGTSYSHNYMTVYMLQLPFMALASIT